MTTPTSSDRTLVAPDLDRIARGQVRSSQVYSPPPFASHASSGSSGEEDDAELGHLGTDDDQPISPDLWRIAAVAGLGGLLFGFDTGVVSGALLSLSRDPSPLPLLSTWQESFLVTSALIGALVASLFAGRLADRLGRKPIIVVAAILFSLGAAEMAAAQVYKEIILGRVLVGFGVGLASCVLPTYLAELSPPKYRGRIVASLVVLITGGQVLAYVVDACFQSTRQGWRWMFGTGVVPGLVQLVLSFSLPESPRHSLRIGKPANARMVVKRLNPTWSPARVQREVERLMNEVGTGGPERLRNDDGDDDGSTWYTKLIRNVRGLTRMNWREKWNESRTRKDRLKALMWDDRANRRSLIIACGLQFWQQATGFNCLMYYSTKVIQQTHLSSPATFALLIAISNFFCTLVALRLIDRTGRRKLLVRGLIGMVLGMIVLSVSFGFIREPAPEPDPLSSSDEGASAAAIVSLIGMTAFCCAYALSLGNVPWVVQSEVFAPDLKALGTGLATGVNWSGNIFVSSTFLHISQGIGPSGAFGLFALVCSFALAFTYLLLPETKGLSLEEVRTLFERDSSPSRSTLGGSGKMHEVENNGDIRAGGGGGGGYHVLGGEEEEEEEEEYETEAERRDLEARSSEEGVNYTKPPRRVGVV